MAAATLRVADRYSPGTTVYAWPGPLPFHGQPHGSPAGQATVADDGTVTFDGLGNRLHLAAQSAAGPFIQFTPDVLTDEQEDNDNLETLERIKGWLLEESMDDIGDTLPNGLRRSLQPRRPIDSEQFPGADDIYVGQSQNSFGEPLNTTAAGFALRFLCQYALKMPHRKHELVPHIQRFADALIPYQWKVGLRAGSFKLAVTDSRASSFATGIIGQGFLEAWEVTQNPRYVDVAIDAADFLMRMADPNPHWDDEYGVTPINRTVGGVTWRGFCDKIDSADRITTTCSSWNLVAAVLLKRIGEFTEDDTYTTVAEQARDFMAPCPLEGYDYFAPETNVATARLTVAVDDNDTTLQIEETGPVALPAAGPAYDLTFGGETMEVTAGFGTTTLTVTRGSSPQAHSVGAQCCKLETYISPIWPDDTNHMPNNHDFNRFGDTAGTGTVGGDKIEYGLNSLMRLGYDEDEVKAAYDYYRGLTVQDQSGNPIPELGEFGLAFNARACWLGFLRLGNPVNAPGPDRHYGSSYDQQHTGEMIGLKARWYPDDDYAATLPIVREVIDHAGPLDENFDTAWSTEIEDTSANGAITLPADTTLTVDSASEFPRAGTFYVGGNTDDIYTYTGKTATTLTGVTGPAGTIADNADINVRMYHWTTKGTIVIAVAGTGLLEAMEELGEL